MTLSLNKKNKLIQRLLAAAVAFSFAFSCGYDSLAANLSESVYSVGESSGVITIYNETLEDDITDSADLYLDNSAAGGGFVSQIVTVRLESAQGGTINYEVTDPCECISVKKETAQSGSELKLTISALGKNAGKASVAFSYGDGALIKILHCNVYTPASDMKIFMGGSEDALPLNDMCDDNHLQLTAVTGHSYSLNAQLLPSNTTDRVKWEVFEGNLCGADGENERETSHAFINDSGTLTAVSEGVVTVKASVEPTLSSGREYAVGEKVLSDGTKSSTAQTLPKYITLNIIEENPAEHISFREDIPLIEIGDSQLLETVVSAKYYGDATDELQWTSSDPSILSVSKKGMITGISQGTAIITVRGENEGVFANMTVRVFKRADSLSLSDSRVVTRVGVPVTVTAQTSPDGSDEEILWSIDDEETASVQPQRDAEFGSVQSALVTGLSEGTTVLTAVTAGSGISKTCEIVVEPRIVSDGLTLSYEGASGTEQIINGGTLNLYTNNSVTIEAALTSPDGSVPDDSVEWSIRNNENAYITVESQSESMIELNGCSEGTAIVCARSVSDPDIYKEFYVQVLKACDKITFKDFDGTNFPSYKSVNVGGTAILRPILTVDGNYPDRHSDKVISFESNNPEVAQVDSNGIISALSNGTAYIKVKTASGKTESKKIEVFTTSEIILYNVTASEDGGLPTAEIDLDEDGEGELTLRAEIRNEYNDSVMYSNPKWTSSDASVATVDNYGVVTAVGRGVTVITVKSGVKTDQCIVFVFARMKYASVDDIPDQYYSPLKGSYEPNPVVTLNGETLVENVDYSISYEDNTEVGRGYVNVEGIGYVDGTKSVSFRIEPRPVDGKEMAFGTLERMKCTGEALCPVPEITCSGILLKPDIDYTCTYSNNTFPGTATVTVKGMGNYDSSVELTFEIYCEHENLRRTEVVQEATCTQTGLAIYKCDCCGKEFERQIPMTPHQYERIVNDSDGTYVYKCVLCGEVTTEEPAEPGKHNISECSATISNSSFAYTGDPVTPEIRLFRGDTELERDKDFTLGYLDNTEIGTGYIIVSGIGDYTGKGKIPFRIYDASSSDADQSDIDTDIIINPDTDTEPDTDTGSDTEKTSDTDSEDEELIDPDDSIDDGRISITQKEIKQLDPVVYSPKSVPYEPRPVVRANQKALIENIDYTITYKNNDEVGTATVIMQGIGSFKGIAQFKFDILPRDLTSGDVNVRAIDKQLCTGKAVTPDPLVLCDGVILEKRKDYKVTYTDNIKPGIATATITGIYNFTGELTVNFQIECTHDYHEQIVAPTHSSKGYTLHTCTICGAAYRDNYVDALSTSDISACDVQLSYNSTSYTGEECTPEVIVTFGSEQLEKGVDYNVSYSNNVNVGLANVTITGLGAYKGLKNVNFQIVDTLLGDVNCDGTVSADDALLTLRYSVGLSDLEDSQLTVGDVTFDGIVSADDSLAILRYTVGMTDSDSPIGKSTG